ASPVGMKELAAGLVEPLVSVGAEIIALGLKEVRWQTLAPGTIIESQGGAESRDGNALLDRCRHRVAPRAMRTVDRFAEERIKQQVREFRVPIEGLFDFTEEDAANNAAAAPHQGDAAVVEVPVVLLSSRAHEHVALRVGNDFRGIQRLANVLNDF